MKPNTEFKAWNAKTKEWYYPDQDAKLTYVGNCSEIINWADVISLIQDKEGCVLPKLIWSNPHFEEMKRLYVNSQYIMYSAEWINYYPEQDYDTIVDQAFGNWVGHPRKIRAWISRINPGKTAPWHWDLDDHEEEYLKGGDIVRFSVRINEPAVGQTAIVGNTALSGATPAGEVYRWPDHRMWHGSANAGLTPKYQYNYIGYAE
jgi:hypothetical protein